MDHRPVARPQSTPGRFARTILVLIGLAYTGWELWKLIGEIRRNFRR